MWRGERAGVGAWRVLAPAAGQLQSTAQNGVQRLRACRSLPAPGFGPGPLPSLAHNCSTTPELARAPRPSPSAAQITASADLAKTARPPAVQGCSKPARAPRSRQWLSGRAARAAALSSSRQQRRRRAHRGTRCVQDSLRPHLRRSARPAAAAMEGAKVRPRRLHVARTPARALGGCSRGAQRHARRRLPTLPRFRSASSCWRSWRASPSRSGSRRPGGKDSALHARMQLTAAPRQACSGSLRTVAAAAGCTHRCTHKCTRHATQGHTRRWRPGRRRPTVAGRRAAASTGPARPGRRPGA